MEILLRQLVITNKGITFIELETKSRAFTSNRYIEKGQKAGVWAAVFLLFSLIQESQR
jgi:hypothetical protein